MEKTNINYAERNEDDIMIPLCIPEIKGNEWNYIKECLDTNWVSSVGSYVNKFEENFGKFVGSESAVVTMNGTSALTLALQTLEIGQDDEVIVPSMTFIASVNPIKYVGAIPVFADITRDTWVLDVTKVEQLITSKTKAIMPVHIYGNMVDMEPLMKLAQKHNIYIIEDATEALGAKYKTSDGKIHGAGTLGDFGAFSFNGNKLITTGGGGMLVRNDIELSKKAKYLANQAKSVRENGAFFHEVIGYNYRMPNVLAAMGVAQLEKIEEYMKIKKEHAKLYNTLLSGIKGITLPTQKDNVEHIYWLYGALVEDDYKMNRDELISYLKEKDIEARPFFEPIHSMKPYVNEKTNGMNITNEISQRGISLPSSVGLKEEEIRYICEFIRG